MRSLTGFRAGVAMASQSCKGTYVVAVDAQDTGRTVSPSCSKTTNLHWIAVLSQKSLRENFDWLTRELLSYMT